MKERNYQILASLVVAEAVNIASHLYTRNSVPLSRTLTMEQALEFTQLLKKAYAGKLEPLQMNPYMSEADSLKQFAILKMAIKDMYPVTPQKIKEFAQKDQSKLASLLDKI